MIYSRKQNLGEKLITKVRKIDHESLSLSPTYIIYSKLGPERSSTGPTFLMLHSYILFSVIHCRSGLSSLLCSILISGQMI